MNTASNNVINFLGSDIPTRTEIFNLLVRAKRSARARLRVMGKWLDVKRKARRKMAMLEQRGVSPFDAHRLGTLYEAICACNASLDELRSDMAQLGHLVMLASPLVDQVLSFEDKAHVLGTSPEQLKRKVARYALPKKMAPGFADLVFSYNAENKDDEEDDFIELYSENEPLFNVVIEYMRRSLQEDQEFAKLTTAFLEDEGIPFYVMKQNPDGTKRLIPRLRLVRKPRKGDDSPR